MRAFFCICLFACAALATACNCEPPLRITPIQRQDKKLSCKAIILEMTESEHYLMLARRSLWQVPTKFYSPSCLLFGVSDAKKAIEAAETRINYLGNLYTLNCNGGTNMDAGTESYYKKEGAGSE
ncbi:MAG: hypothetical protein ABW189_06215 [Rickettsiales bacterium]